MAVRDEARHAWGSRVKNFRDRYGQVHQALIEMHSHELSPTDPIEASAVETATRVDFAIDEMQENSAKVENDQRGLRR